MVQQDHPRIRGEHESEERSQAVSTGSSPHTRGALAVVVRRSDKFGIIPAYAGSTAGRRSAGRRSSDHPRIRGEHSTPQARFPSWRGSSPHTRGALGLAVAHVAVGGIIPAYAGSTRDLLVAIVAGGDHPRIRGEHFSSRTPRTTCWGSSPHTRGALWRALGQSRRLGIIPAYAGSTSIRRRRESLQRDHPRIRGEHQPAILAEP